jgi:hypothetical protein
MKILYKPFGIIAALIGGRIATAIFKAVWARIDEEEPPKPTTEDASFPKVVGAAVLEAATMAGVGAVVERGGARAFHHLTGIWPGDKEADKD